MRHVTRTARSSPRSSRAPPAHAHVAGTTLPAWTMPSSRAARSPAPTRAALGVDTRAARRAPSPTAAVVKLLRGRLRARRTSSRRRCSAPGRARLVISDPSVVCDRTRRMDLGRRLPRRTPSSTARPPVESACSAGIRRPNGTRSPVSRVTCCPATGSRSDGVRVTTPLRTAADLGCSTARRTRLGAMDALARAHGFSQQDIAGLLRRYRGAAAWSSSATLVATLDPRAESQPESWMPVVHRRRGPGPARAAGLGHGRGSLGPPRPGVPARPDPGRVRRRGVPPCRTAARRHDEQRRAALRRAGWIVIVVTQDGLAAAVTSVPGSPSCAVALRSRRVRG